jgi:hypothetical protein
MCEKMETKTKQKQKAGNIATLAVCYKCGKEKIATTKDPVNYPHKMIMMSYGKHKNQYYCSNCKEV